MQVFDKDTFTKDNPIGEVQIPLLTIPDLLQEKELGKITRGKDGSSYKSASRIYKLIKKSIFRSKISSTSSGQGEYIY